MLAEKIIPDLIISDLAMPKMTGYEVVEYLKENVLTSHIPIIILTAKSAIESKLKSLKLGADSYLTKPFHTEELLVRINNYIQLRKQIQNYLSLPKHKSGEGPLDIKEISKLDKEFLDGINNCLDDNLANYNFTVEQLAKAMYMSRSQLFRKLKALTSQSPNSFIRNFRLDIAYDKLSNQKRNVSTIAYEVGFENSKYFSTRFKDRFGIAPSELI